MLLQKPLAAFLFARHMKAALHALDQLNALAWQHNEATGHGISLQQQPISQNDLVKSASLDRLKRSLSMPEKISRDTTRPLLASVLEEVEPSLC